MAEEREDLFSRVEIFVSCRNLKKMDFNSMSDPFLVFSMSKDGRHWVEEGRTETVEDCHDPDFKKQFKVKYYFEEMQHLKLDVYDRDSKTSQDLKKHDFMGSVTMLLADLVSSPGQRVTKPLLKKGKAVKGSDSSKHSTVTVRCEEIAGGHDTITLKLIGQKLTSRDFWGKSDPYIEFQRQRPIDKSWIPVHQTEYIKSNLNPIWKVFVLPTQKLCNGDVELPLKMICWDWNKNAAPDLIGECITSVAELTTNPTLELLKLSHQKPGDKKAKKRYGKIKVLEAKITQNHSFLDFIAGGMQIGVSVAIDYTASNKQPSDPRSLHYLSNAPNAYEECIQAVCSILMAYDSDQQIATYGFGGKVQGRSGASHCFAINFNESNPELPGVSGILGAYRNSLNYVQLSGPTFFHEVIQKAAALASAPMSATHQHYSILLIITDGQYLDRKQTIDAIVEASDRPLSIIIVGVGNADFTAMDELDADERALKSEITGKFAKRDIVQFVGFNQSRNRLAKDVLMEVPQQVVEFFKAYKINPLPKRAAVPYDYNAPPATNLGPPQAPPPAAAAPQLAHGWEARVDPASGQAYYVNHHTQETTWNMPTA